MPSIELALHEIPFDEPFRVEQEGTPIVVIRTQHGISAYYDVCPHAQWPLSDGEIVDGYLECPGHGWQFRLESGQCINAPAYCLTALPVRVDSTTVRIDCEQCIEN